MVRYTPASRGGIPGPQQASDQAIAQIDRQTQRIVKALQEERDAAIANRDRISNAMIQNQKIESAQAATNNKIALQNQQTLFEKQAAIRKQALDEYNASTAASQEMFATISKFSDKAASKLQEMEKERYLKTWREDLAIEMSNGALTPLAKEARENELEQEENVTQYEGGLIKGNQLGADPLDTSSAAAQIVELSPGVQAANMMKAARGWGLHIATLQKTFVDVDGSEFTAQEAMNDPRKLEYILNQELPEFLESKGLVGINPGVLWNSGMLPSIVQQNQAMINKATQQQIAANRAQVETNALNYLAVKGPEDLATAIQKAYRMMQAAGIPNPQINKKLDNFAVTQFALKNPYFDANTYIKALSGPNNEPVGAARKVQLQIDFLNAQNSARNAEAANKRLIADEWVATNLPKIQARLEAATTDEEKLGIVTEFRIKYGNEFEGRSDSRITNLEKETLSDIKSQEETQLANMLATGSVTSLSQADDFQIPSVRAKFLEALASSKTAKFGTGYADVEKEIKSKAEKLWGYTPSVAGRGSPEAVVLEQVLIRNLRQHMSVLTAPGAKYANNPDAAVSEALARQEAEIVKGKTDKNSLFYRDENGVFVNIERGITRQTDTINGRIYLMNKEISLGNDPFKVQELVLPTSELTAKVRQLEQGTGQFDVGPEIRALARAKGMTNFDAFIRLVESRGIQHNIPEVLSLNMSNIEYRDPATARMLDNTEIRTPVIIKRAAAVSGGTVNNFIRGPFTGVKGELLGTIIGGEAGNSYSAMAPSENYPEVLDMTIDEVVAFQKQKLRDGRRSAAIGGYQFLEPEKAADQAGIPRTAKFTPENQDRMAMAYILGGKKQPALTAYLNGESDDLRAAHIAIANEWAALQGPDGYGMYDTDGHNHATVPAAKVRELLIRLRREVSGK